MDSTKNQVIAGSYYRACSSRLQSCLHFLLLELWSMLEPPATSKPPPFQSLILTNPRIELARLVGEEDRTRIRYILPLNSSMGYMKSVLVMCGQPQVGVVKDRRK
jgi:hypothetical protein